MQGIYHKPSGVATAIGCRARKAQQSAAESGTPMPPVADGCDVTVCQPSTQSVIIGAPTQTLRTRVKYGRM